MDRPSRIGERLPGVVSATPHLIAARLLMELFRSGLVTVPMDQPAATAFSATSQIVVCSPLNGFQQGSIEPYTTYYSERSQPTMESHRLRAALRFCRFICPRSGRQTSRMKLHCAPGYRRKWSRPIRDNPRQHQPTSHRHAT